MSHHDVTADRVFALLHGGCRTRADLAAELGVLSSSRWLDDAIVDLQQRGLITVSASGDLVPVFDQPTFDSLEG